MDGWMDECMERQMKTVLKHSKFTLILIYNLEHIQIAAAKSLSCVQLCATPWTAAYPAPLSMGFSRQEHQSGVPLPSPQVSLSITKSPRVYSDSCPLSWWWHPTISSSVPPFPSSCSHSFPVSGSFTMTQLFTWGGPSSGASASASVFPMNIQGSFYLGWTAVIFMFMYICIWDWETK